jgi:hypothetical protein
MRPTAAALILAVSSLAAGGCGYALSGRGVTVDPTIKRIGVPPFKDRTHREGLEEKISQAVIEELLKRGHFEVVQDSTGVDALVDGELTSYTARAVGFGATGGEIPGGGAASEATRYTITVTARVRYAKVGATEPIWVNESFSDRDEYDLGSDPASLFDRENQAIDRLSVDFARKLVAAMLEAF